MHKATKLIKSHVGGSCRFINELDHDLYLISVAPEANKEDAAECTYPIIGGIRYMAVDHGSIRVASEDEIRLGFRPNSLKRIKEIKASNPHQNCNAIFEKYLFQREDTLSMCARWADNDREKALYAAYDKWMNNGQPTGIRSDREFYHLQEAYYGNVIFYIEND